MGTELNQTSGETKIEMAGSSGGRFKEDESEKFEGEIY